MIDLYVAILLCVIQATLVAGTACVLCRWASRRNPGGAAAVVAAATTAILVLTAVVFVPLPEAMRWPLELGGMRSAETADARLAAAVQSRADSPASGTGADGGSVEIDLRKMKLDQSEHSETARGLLSSPDWDFWLAAVALVGVTLIVLFVARQVWGLRAVWRLRRQSRPIVDARLFKLCDPLQKALHCGSVELRETDELGTAATVGHVCPTILLPGDWREWTDAELKAVLAHELAHVLRHDCATRFVGCLCGAIHFYHPLVRWLLRRLVLEQEFAADRLAADAVGGWRTYVGALSRFALRHVEGPAMSVCPAFLPVSSSFLMRRIEMLRTMDGAVEPRRATRARRTAVLVLLIVALTAAGLRGSAECAEDKAPTDASKAQRVHQDATESQGPENLIPTNNDFDPTNMSLFEHGIFMIRVKAMLDHPSIQSMKQEFLKSYRAGYKEAFGSGDPPILPEDIEFVAMVPCQESYTDPKTGREMMTLRNGPLLVRMSRADDWKARVKRSIPGTEEKQGPDGTYLNVPVPPELGPIKATTLQFVDDRTILFGLSEDSPVGKERFSGKQNPWATHWKTVANADIAMVYDMDTIKWPKIDADKLNSDSKNQRLLAKNGQFQIFSFGWADDSDRLRILFRITAKPNASIPEIKTAFERALKVKPDDWMEDSSMRLLNSFTRFLSTATIKTGTADNGDRFVDAEFEGNYSLEELMADGQTKSTTAVRR